MTVRQQPQRIHLSLPVPSRATVYRTLGGLGGTLYLGGAGGIDQLAFTAPEARAAVVVLALGILLLAAAFALRATRPGGAQ